jgi:DNA-binding transcriptional LysR family regulator
VSAFYPPYFIEMLHAVELRLYRNLTVELVTGYSLDLISLLLKHELDLALATSPPPSAQITSIRISTNPFMIALREKHPLANRTSIRLDELASFPWIFFNRNVHYHLHDLILRRMKEESGPINIRHSVSHE